MTRLLTILVLLMPAILFAEIYKTVDVNGCVIFIDKPTAKAEQVDVNVNSVEDPATVSGSQTNLFAGGEVVMYHTSWCGVCKTAKSYMQQSSISFKGYDLEKNSNTHRKFKSLGGKGVPLL